MTWKELKEFCNELNETQLEKKVILWREEEAISNICAEQLEEEYYNFEDCEGCIPISEVIKMSEDEFAFPNGMDDFVKVYDKGDPLLHEEF
jgi:hypothetical protein